MLTTALVALLLSADPAAAAKPSESKESKKAEVILRGEKLSGEAQKVTLQDLVTKADQYDGKTVALEGTARKVCKKKGCWMELATSNDAKADGIRVTFKDYGFFVPVDAAGAAVKMEGVVKVAELNEAHARHLEEEGATVRRGQDGKPREVQLIANGVELRR